MNCTPFSMYLKKLAFIIAQISLESRQQNPDPCLMYNGLLSLLGSVMLGPWVQCIGMNRIYDAQAYDD